MYQFQLVPKCTTDHKQKAMYILLPYKNFNFYNFFFLKKKIRGRPFFITDQMKKYFVSL